MKVNLPNFLCVGAQKAGTTSLHNILRQHPDIFLPILKEAHFFDTEESYEKGIDWYKDTFFYNYKSEKAVGAITPDYLYFNKVPNRILKHLGNDVKLIFLLRNPVDRAYSHYLMNRRRDGEEITFEEAVRIEIEKIKKNEFNDSRFSYIGRGLYAKQIKRYLDIFQRKNMYFVMFEEDFIQKREVTIKKLLEFLDVKNQSLNINIKSNIATLPRIEPLKNLLCKPNVMRKLGKAYLPINLRVNIRKGLKKINQRQHQYEKLDPTFRAYLIETCFMEDINLLQGIIKRDLSNWLK